MTRIFLSIAACFLAGGMMTQQGSAVAGPDPCPCFDPQEGSRAAEEGADVASEAREAAREARERARTMANEVRARVAAMQSYLGVGVAEVDSERAKVLKLSEERGVEIKNVETGSAAEKAGLQKGDVVVEYNGQRVEGVEQFQRYVRETPPGRKVRLVISRDGATQTVTAKLGTRRAVIARWDESGLNIPIPPVPPVPPIHIDIPDLPRNALSWRNNMLGIETESLGPQLAAFFGVKRGVLVRSVSKESAAGKADIKAGDVIVKVGNTDVSTPRELSNALRSAQGKSVAVVLVRSQKELTVVVEIAAGGPVRRMIGEPTDALTRTRA